MSHLGHLARRFFGSLRPGPPATGDEAWAESQLLPGEVALWRRMSNPDRRHAAGVARDVESMLGADASRPVLAAALLHDMGKVESGLGTFGRVGATIVTMAAGRRRVGAWSGRIGRYVRHPAIGTALLEDADSDPLTVAWAREHHLPSDRWTIDRRLADALKAADDD